MTNFDQLKLKTVEELADWLLNNRSNCTLPMSCPDLSCRECLVLWLKSEVDECVRK